MKFGVNENTNQLLKVNTGLSGKQGFVAAIDGFIFSDMAENSYLRENRKSIGWALNPASKLFRNTELFYLESERGHLHMH